MERNTAIIGIVACSILLAGCLHSSQPADQNQPDSQPEDVGWCEENDEGQHTFTLDGDHCLQDGQEFEEAARANGYNPDDITGEELNVVTDPCEGVSAVYCYKGDAE